MVKLCKKNKENFRNEKIVNFISNNNSKDFWKEIKRTKGSNHSITSKIDDETNDQNITELFSNHFKNTLLMNIPDNNDFLHFHSDFKN